ncbi:MAG: starch-binding protein [Muribaculaceae bacterium]|nr:starch-binding protein [Muribaculaceae bacterium]
MIKKLTIYCSCLMALLFSGCAEDDWFMSPDQVPDRDYAEINLAVAEPQHVSTRAAYSLSDDISTATVLIYKGESNYANATLLQTAKFGYGGDESEGNASNSLKVKYNDDVKNQLKNGSVYLFVVANRTYTTAPATVDALYKDKDGVAATDLVKQARNIVMTGSFELGTPGDVASVAMASKADLNKGINVAMRRDLARLAVATDEETVQNFVLTSYNVWSAAPNAYTASGVSGAADNTGFAKNSSGTVNSEEQTPSSDSENPNFVYAYAQPKPNYTDAKNLNDPSYDNRAFVIIGGEYAGETCYYRVDLRKKNDENKWEYLFLTANHQYDVTIKKVKGKGYASRELAAQNPQQDIIETDIHDHVPAVLSIASDGVRELGVEYEANLNATKNYISLSLFSKISSSEYPASVADFTNKQAYSNNDFSIEVIEGAEWLKLESLSKLSANESNDSEYTESTSNSGVGYHLVVSNASKYDMGTMEGKIRVTWRGLTREVNVKWSGDFDPTKICSASLKISYRGSDTENNASVTKTNDLCYTNYWNFLKSTTTYGVSSAANEGRIRNQGLHIPYYYGGSKDGDKWEYEYKLTLTSEVYNSDDEVTVKTEGLTFSPDDLTVAGNVITLKARSDSFGLRYFVGDLIIMVNGIELPPIDIYHTGFFHRVKASTSDSDDTTPLTYEKKGDAQAGWYYYEVRSFGNRYWLDRNICATATGMSILSQSGDVTTNYISDGGEFNSGATGGYFLPAKGENYGDVNANIHKVICPPGFRIPNTTEWDIIRNSYGFDNGMQIKDGKTYYASKVEDLNGNMIYLPKVMYYHNELHKMVGDSRAGYYWTKSEAPGLEKAQIGHWLRALMLSGESNSYMHGNVDKYAMQVRAIDDADEEVSQSTIAFKVTGATHVYIYDAGEEYGKNADGSVDMTRARKKDGIKAGLMAWPGVAIGDPKTMRSNKSWYNPEYNRDATEYVFNYVTNSNKEDLRFVFNYVTDSGKIYTFSRRVDGNESGAARYNGWPLAEIFKFGIDDLNDKSEQTFSTTVEGNVTEITSDNYISQIGKPVTFDNRPDITYKFYVLKTPPNTTNDPSGFRLKVQEKAGSSSYKTLVNKNWGGENLTATETYDGKTYYVITYVTKEKGWGFNYTYTWNNGNNVSGETAGGKDAFKKVSDTEYVTTIYEMFKAKPSSPDAAKIKYRIYWPYSSSWKGLDVWTAGDVYKVDGDYSSYPNDQTIGSPSGKYKRYSDTYCYWETEIEEIPETINWYDNEAEKSHSFKSSLYSADSDGVLSVTFTSKASAPKSGGPSGGGGAESYTIYYTNPEGWTTPHVYLYVGSTNSGHKAMTKVNDTKWSYTFENTNDYNAVIFTNGSWSDDKAKTDDLALTNNKTYNNSAKEYKDEPTLTAGYRRIYVKDLGWSPTYLWCVKNDNTGESKNMTQLKKNGSVTGWLYCDIDKNNYKKVLFRSTLANWNDGTKKPGNQSDEYDFGGSNDRRIYYGTDGKTTSERPN